jgi:hypothetical protein
LIKTFRAHLKGTRDGESRLDADDSTPGSSARSCELDEFERTATYTRSPLSQTAEQEPAKLQAFLEIPAADPKTAEHHGGIVNATGGVEAVSVAVASRSPWPPRCRH